MNFKGTTSSYAKIKGTTSLDLQGSFTLTAYLYITTATIGPLFSWYSDKIFGPHIWIITPPRLFFRINGESPFHGTAINTLDVGAWNRVAVTFRHETGEVGFYTNGKVEWLEHADLRYTIPITSGDVYMANR